MTRMTEEEKKRIRQTDLVEYLRSRGYELKHEGSGNYRLPGHGGLIIQGNHWHQKSTGLGGNAIDFLVRIEGMGFRAAAQELAGFMPASLTSLYHQRTLNRPETSPARAPFQLPTRAPNNRRVFAFLMKERGLPGDMVAKLVRVGLLYQDDKGNCVFPCLDGGEAKGAIKRGTNTYISTPFKGNAPGSDVSYGWYWPMTPARDNITLVVTEAPIDAISLVALQNRPEPITDQVHLLALGGLHQQALDSFFGRHPEVKQVILALDNDEPGRAAAAKWKTQLERDGRVVSICTPQRGKDWNEELHFEKAAEAPRYYEPVREQAAEIDYDR